MITCESNHARRCREGLTGPCPCALARPMNIHEYQAKELLAKYGVPVPAGHAALSVEEAVAAAAKLPGPLYVVKAQIHAGGRGKGKFKELGPDAKGGVRLARSTDEVRA